MATEVIMPKVDMVMETGTFVEWLKKEGEHVNKGDPLFVIDTDKAAIEMESPADGILSGVRAKLNDVIPVTEIIAYILAPGESLPGKAVPQQVLTIPASPLPKVDKAPEPVGAVAHTTESGKVRVTGDWPRSCTLTSSRSPGAGHAVVFTKRMCWLSRNHMPPPSLCVCQMQCRHPSRRRPLRPRYLPARPQPYLCRMPAKSR
jgi:pyruvate/2-oxoglutarate dehydrogenase complex dihydrolipoamide acyltransferase (E2) component